MYNGVYGDFEKSGVAKAVMGEIYTNINGVPYEIKKKFGEKHRKKSLP